MGKFKEIDLDITETIYKIIKIQIYILAIIGTIGVFVLSVENCKLEENIKLIEQDRTELIIENNELQEENNVLKRIIDNSKMQNNYNTRGEE